MPLCFLLQRQINAGGALGILADIVHQVIEHAPQAATVCHNFNRLLRLAGEQNQILLLKLLLILTGSLCQHHTNFTGSQQHLQITRGRLRSLHEIVNEPLQAVGLTMEYTGIFCNGGVVALLFSIRSA